MGLLEVVDGSGGGGGQHGQQAGVVVQFDGDVFWIRTGVVNNIFFSMCTFVMFNGGLEKTSKTTFYNERRAALKTLKTFIFF